MVKKYWEKLIFWRRLLGNIATIWLNERCEIKKHVWETLQKFLIIWTLVLKLFLLKCVTPLFHILKIKNMHIINISYFSLLPSHSIFTRKLFNKRFHGDLSRFLCQDKLENNILNKPAYTVLKLTDEAMGVNVKNISVRLDLCKAHQRYVAHVQFGLFLYECCRSNVKWNAVFRMKRVTIKLLMSSSGHVLMLLKIH